MGKIKLFIQNEIKDYKILINSVPTAVFSIFVIAVFCMNLMANKSILLPVDWLALDCGIVVSWFVFLMLDVLTKHFGYKASTKLSIFATIINLGICFVFYIVSVIPGVWAKSDVLGSQDIINTALDLTFGGTWYIILGSVVAFLVSSFINNFSNHFIGKLFLKNPDGLIAYMSRSYISTVLAQFFDNFLFTLIVSRNFFGWSLEQCITCSVFGMIVELICEIVFSLYGYRICERWKKNNVGYEYLSYKEKRDKI